MGTTKKSNVDLVIRARDEATKTLKAISGAFDQFVKGQKGGEAAAGDVKSAVTALTAELTQLGKVQQELAGKQKLIQDFRKQKLEAVALSKTIKQVKDELQRLKAAQAGKSGGVVSDTDLSRTKQLEKRLQTLSTQYDKTNSKLHGTRKALAAAGIQTKGLAAASIRLKKAQVATGTEADRLRGKISTLTATQKRANAAIRSSGGRQAVNGFRALRQEIVALAAAYVGLQGAIRTVNTLYETQRRFQAAENRLKVAFDGDTKRAGQELKFMRQEADRLGVNFETLTENYTKFLFAANKANLTQEQSRQIFRGVTETAVVNRLSNEELALSYKAVIQVMSKGKVQAEELRNQLGDHIPGAVQIMATALGKSTKELDKMMEQGQLTAETLVDLANEMRDQVAGVLPDATKSLTAEVSRFQNAWTDLKREVNDSGFRDIMREVLVELTKALKSADVKQLARDFVTLAGAIGKVIRIIVSNLPALKTALLSIVAYKILSGFFKLSGAIGGVNLKVKGLLKSLRAVPGLLAAVATAAYSLGTYLYNTFDAVQVAGLNLVTIFETLKTLFKSFFELLSGGLKLALDQVISGFKKDLAAAAELLADVAGKVGFDESAARFGAIAQALRGTLGPTKTFSDL
ncbi:MAG: tape measure protein, partial [Candidatus Thiodiazotropha sp. (ex Notomyrtea botanica)]|nr:tape measure protein [Candidatus Thiodiazotropha sp. (ex Notomyrtea botanica)]